MAVSARRVSRSRLSRCPGSRGSGFGVQRYGGDQRWRETRGGALLPQHRAEARPSPAARPQIHDSGPFMGAIELLRCYGSSRTPSRAAARYAKRSRKFLRASDEIRYEWKLAKNHCEHVHGIIDEASISAAMRSTRLPWARQRPLYQLARQEQLPNSC